MEIYRDCGDRHLLKRSACIKKKQRPSVEIAITFDISVFDPSRISEWNHQLAENAGLWTRTRKQRNVKGVTGLEKYTTRNIHGLIVLCRLIGIDRLLMLYSILRHTSHQLHTINANDR